jgi:hypothetical protein
VPTKPKKQQELPEAELTTAGEISQITEETTTTVVVGDTTVTIVTTTVTTVEGPPESEVTAHTRHSRIGT